MLVALSQFYSRRDAVQDPRCCSYMSLIIIWFFVVLASGPTVDHILFGYKYLLNTATMIFHVVAGL